MSARVDAVAARVQTAVTMGKVRLDWHLMRVGRLTKIANLCIAKVLYGVNKGLHGKLNLVRKKIWAVDFSTVLFAVY